MKLKYFANSDTLYIDLIDRNSIESEEVSQDITLDFDPDGKVVGITIDFASKKVDLKTLETSGFPTPIASSNSL